MENNEIGIKSHIKNRPCYCFDDMSKLEDFDLDKILIYDVSLKTLMDSMPLRIRFDKIDEIIKISDGTRYLTLFGSEKYNAI